MEGNMGEENIVKKTEVVCTICGLLICVLTSEIVDVYEAKPIKEHMHTHIDYQRLGESAYVVSGMSSSAAGIDILEIGPSP